MHLDIRVPIGLLFCIIGLILFVDGLASDPSVYARSLGINVNLWWGGALFLFGGVMLFLARRSLPGFRRPPGEG